MIALAPTTRIFIHTEPTDMRKSFNGLSGIVKQHFKVDLFSGHLFVFFNRKRDYVKILIETGARLPGTLSHHRTCESACGGSFLGSKLAPSLVKAP
ncbi:IS66 family insertion sequence element accessory protein TnpB [Rhodopirellula sp. MGV]|uniref:IS66 family insertion sequence element accessory protein TnpB n=1 Tax=Rhodopirellula sp. MGV TaxID=2023130 RepID=UPI000B976283|nr:IS66 family insertion sequence element accessory protein TnpB [Rhodopirellula sp. MGV]OYP32194.1 hypothetical protein CGZ80_20285 [Rhodopirellula sp. MGV]PNY38009.1 hypothetical protein C2E31_04830 [Rhodopirellula baltica]